LYAIYWNFRLSIEFYLTARKYRLLSPADREHVLAAHPELRAKFLAWLKNHEA
jgi:hypothetical protein